MATRPTFADLFQTPKPVIAMAHLPALPGTPRHRAGTSLDELVERVRTDLDHLLAGGVDAVMFCNEDDRPYRLSVGPEIPATMAAVVAELRPRDRPFGVDVLWDPARGDGAGAGHRRRLHARGGDRNLRERHGALGAGRGGAPAGIAMPSMPMRYSSSGTSRPSSPARSDRGRSRIGREAR